MTIIISTRFLEMIREPYVPYRKQSERGETGECSISFYENETNDQKAYLIITFLMSS